MSGGITINKSEENKIQVYETKNALNINVIEPDGSTFRLMLTKDQAIDLEKTLSKLIG